MFANRSTIGVVVVALALIVMVTIFVNLTVSVVGGANLQEAFATLIDLVKSAVP